MGIEIRWCKCQRRILTLEEMGESNLCRLCQEELAIKKQKDNFFVKRINTNKIKEEKHG